MGCQAAQGTCVLRSGHKAKYQMPLELENSNVVGLGRIFIASLEQEGTVRH